jgi:hypothetical protein
LAQSRHWREAVLTASRFVRRRCFLVV